MISRERVLIAVSHREPDRLPITFDAEKEVKDALKKHFGVPDDEGVWRSLNVDTRLVGASHHHTNIGKMPGGINVDYWGVGVGQVEYSFGTMYDICHHPLEKMETVAELDGYNWPTADEISFEGIAAARAKNPDKAIIAYFCHGGYFTGTEMRGMERFLMDLAYNPEFAARLIDKITGYIYPSLERLCDEAADAFDIFYIADDFCTASGPLISPGMFRELIKPYLRRMAGIVHARGKRMLLHTCGSVRALLPDIIDAGVDILEPIQTSAAGMAVEGLKADFGERLTFYGSIDLINVLSKGTPAEVRAEVLHNFRVLGAGGGFIVGPGHTYIQPDTPLENILAMYETAYRECVYR